MLRKRVEWHWILLGVSILLHLNVGSDLRDNKKQMVLIPNQGKQATSRAGSCTTDLSCHNGMCCNNQCRCPPGFQGQLCDVAIGCDDMQHCSGHGICMHGRSLQKFCCAFSVMSAKSTRCCMMSNHHASTNVDKKY